MLEKPFCRLIRFKRFSDDSATVTELKTEPIVLVCVPLSAVGPPLHAAARHSEDTVARDHKVYLTDWLDARMVPQTARFIWTTTWSTSRNSSAVCAKNLHVISVCQPTVPVLAAISLMASRGEDTPRTMTMMGGPIDARRSPTSVNSLASEHSYEWFENNVIYTVPANYPGVGRKVYPGFLCSMPVLSP